MEDEPDGIAESLLDELGEAAPDFTGAVTLLLEGAAKAKSPKSAHDLIGFCDQMRDLIASEAEPDQIAEALAFDLERTRPLWNKLVSDRRDYGLLTLPGAPYTVGDVSSAVLESLATAYGDEDSMEALWTMSNALGGHHYQFTIERGSGFTGVEILQQPWNDKLDLLAEKSWEDPGVRIILRNLGVYRLLCEGVLLVRIQFDGNADDDLVQRASIWPVAIKPNLPAEVVQWKEVLPDMADEETEQKEFVDFLMKAFGDAKSAGNGIFMELYAFPAGK